MSKSMVLFLLLVFSSLWQLSAQSTNTKLKFGAIEGYDFYNQKDLKFVNKSLSDMLPFDVRVIDDFKQLFWGGYALYQLSNHFYLGPSYEFHYTGSRIGARDYSGVFSFDQYVHMHQIGLKSGYTFLQSEQLFLDAETNGGISLTRWKMDNYLKIGDGDSERQIDYLNGFGWYLSPAIKVGSQVFPRVNLTTTVGYSFDLKEKYQDKDDRNLKIIKCPNWNGLKISLGVEFLLK
jgi:hypothetical protein